MKYNILVGGAAGQGMDTVSSLIEKILKRKGYYVYSHKDYMSRVRGGHNFIQIRFGTEQIYSHWPVLDVVIAMDQVTVEQHLNRLSPNGVLLCDEGIKVEDNRVYPIPMDKIAAELGNPKTSGTVAAGACIKLFSQNLDKVEDLIKEKFGEAVSAVNYQAFKSGHDCTESKFEICSVREDEHILINGNSAIALGALAGGLGFFASYPMTPATSIMTQLALKQDEAGIVVEQVEDELSAINMVLGASYAGVRSMTATSGGGFALMVEALSLQGIMEVPLVVVDSQRPGPSTGMATRTEQSDLDFVLTAGHGEFPRAVISVRNPEDAFYQAARALNLADKYQSLVILLTDEYLADVMRTITPFDFTKISIDKYLVTKEDLGEEVYKRYKVTDSGISPRLIPGKVENQVVMVDSHEHTEGGHISEVDEIRVMMMNKRMKKLKALAVEMQEPEFIGAEDPKTLLIGWGSMEGPMIEAVELLNAEGVAAGALVFGDLYPLPEKLLRKYSEGAEKVVNVEQNFTGQLAKLIRQETGIAMNHSILKYDGRQMDAHYIYERVKKEVL